MRADIQSPVPCSLPLSLSSVCRPCEAMKRALAFAAVAALAINTNVHGHEDDRKKIDTRRSTGTHLAGSEGASCLVP